MATEAERREQFEKWFAEEFEHLNPLGPEAARMRPIFNAGYSQAVEDAARWIPVEESLPHHDQTKGWKDRGAQYRCSIQILAYNGTRQTAEMLTNPQGESVWVNGDETVKNVTHWMPLPYPPGALPTGKPGTKGRLGIEKEKGGAH